MPMVKKITTIRGVAPWVGSRDAHTGRWVASCDVLNLSTEADTWSELVEMSQDVMRLLLESLAETGELSDFLQARGFAIETSATLDHEKPVFDFPSPIFFTGQAAVA